MKTGPRANICRSVCFAQIGWRVGKRRTISNLGRENLPYYLNCFALFGRKTGSGWYRPSLWSRSARGTGLRFALLHSVAKSGRYIPISWLVCFAQIGWRVGKRRIHTELGREKKPYWMYVSPRSADAGVKGEFTLNLVARRSFTEWIVSPILAGKRNLDDTDQIFILIPRANRLPKLTQPTHTLHATPPREQATLAYPTQGFPNRTPQQNSPTQHCTK